MQQLELMTISPLPLGGFSFTVVKGVVDFQPGQRVDLTHSGNLIGEGEVTAYGYSVAQDTTEVNFRVARLYHLEPLPGIPGSEPEVAITRIDDAAPMTSGEAESDEAKFLFLK